MEIGGGLLLDCMMLRESFPMIGRGDTDSQTSIDDTQGKVCQSVLLDSQDKCTNIISAVDSPPENVMQQLQLASPSGTAESKKQDWPITFDTSTTDNSPAGRETIIH